jgi:hypothetical protein
MCGATPGDSSAPRSLARMNALVVNRVTPPTLGQRRRLIL